MCWIPNHITDSLEIDAEDTEAALFDQLFIYIWNYSFWGPRGTNCKLLIILILKHLYLVIFHYDQKAELIIEFLFQTHSLN